MKTKNLTLTAIFTALTIVLAQISIPLAFTPVPFTLCIMGILLTGAILPKKYALYSVLTYVLLGAVGIPVFAGFSGGIGDIVGPTGGFIIGYPLMAFFIAWMLELVKKKTPISYIPAMLGGLACCYLLGSLWYMIYAHIGWAQSLVLTVLPFALFDVIKIVLCAVLSFAINRALSKSKLIQIG